MTHKIEEKLGMRWPQPEAGYIRLRSQHFRLRSWSVNNTHMLRTVALQADKTTHVLLFKPTKNTRNKSELLPELGSSSDDTVGGNHRVVVANCAFSHSKQNQGPGKKRGPMRNMKLVIPSTTASNLVARRKHHAGGFQSRYSSWSPSTLRSCREEEGPTLAEKMLKMLTRISVLRVKITGHTKSL